MSPTPTATIGDLWGKHHHLALTIISLLLAGTSGCLPEAQATPKLPAAPRPTEQPPALTTVTPTPTPLLTDTPLPSLTPTFGAPITRTPALAAQCPKPGEQTSLPITVDSIYDGFYYEGEEPNPETGVLGYLNAHGSAAGLQDILSNLRGYSQDPADFVKAQVITKDVTGDSTPDVIVSITIPTLEGGYGDAFVTVYVCRDELYRSHMLFLRAGAGSRGEDLYSGGIHIRAVQDMNQDGVAEIAWFAPSLGDLHIAGWDGTQFASLVDTPADCSFWPDNWPNCTAPYIYGIYGSGYGIYDNDIVIQDTDGNGTLEVSVTFPLSRPGVDTAGNGPRRERTKIWAWNGYHFVPTRTLHTPPQYRFQAIRDGDNASQFGDYAQALAFYQQAISDERLLGWSVGQLWPDDMYNGSPTPTPDPYERSRLSAYAHYRIILLYVVQGKLKEAQRTYDTLQSEFPNDIDGHQYAELGKAFWDEYQASLSIPSACAKVIKYARMHADEVLMLLDHRFYGYANDGFSAEGTCPFW